MLFNDASKALLEQIEKIVRLIRSKGVGVYFITQNPMDIPENVLGQLGNKVQHALRAFTPKDQKAVKAVAQSFCSNPNLDTEKALLELETGEALISFLNEKGNPNIVERAKMLCPQGQIGPITEAERSDAMKNSGLENKYGKTMDRESAYEMLQKIDEAKKREEERLAQEKELEKEKKEREKAAEKERKATSKVATKSKSVFWSVLNKLLTNLGNALIKNLLGTSTKKRKR